MNEIFKGMDNASEAINENFEKLEKKSGQNENGYWEISDGKIKAYATVNITDSGWQSPTTGGFKGVYKNTDFDLPIAIDNVIGVKATINQGGPYLSPWVTEAYLRSEDTIRIVLSNSTTSGSNATVFYEVIGTTD